MRVEAFSRFAEHPPWEDEDEVEIDPEAYWDAIFAAGRALEATQPMRHGACDNCGRPSTTFICPRCTAWEKGKVTP